jgi:hypothetical protein
LSHDGWVDADEELFFLVDCETLFIANAQDIPFKNLVRYVYQVFVLSPTHSELSAGAFSIMSPIVIETKSAYNALSL